MTISSSNHLLLADPDQNLLGQVVSLISQDGNCVIQAADSHLALELLASNVFIFGGYRFGPALQRQPGGNALRAGAHAIHANSPRRDGTMVAVNCAALSETILESQFFGHEKEAFTGAHIARAGRFQQAHGGTLFLDEVGEMSPAIQAKVLRAIEDQVIYRLGGSREIHVDVRVMAAINRDLTQAVETGMFNKDLYYRLNVATLDLASLRKRRPDILPLAEMFLRRICQELKCPERQPDSS